MISKLKSTVRRIVWAGLLAVLATVLLLIADNVLLRDDDDGPIEAGPD